MRYFVYALIDPRTNIIFYIGMGDRERVRNGYRPNDHILETRSYIKNKKYKKGQNIEKLALIPIIKELYESESFSEISEKEVELIALHKTTITNKNDGGGGKPFIKGTLPWNTGKTYTYEDIMGTKKANSVKKKKSDVSKERGILPPSAKGVTRTDEWKKSHSDFWKNKPKTEEQKKKISETNKLKNIRPPSTKGSTQTAESNKKRSDSLKQYWINKKRQNDKI